MELPHIGQNCVICNRNDYLPFKCKHCHKVVCIDHKTSHGTDCQLAKDSFQYKPGSEVPPESLKAACDFCKLITLKLELVECIHCKQNHCLYHRHQTQHGCKQLDEAEEKRQQVTRDRQERQKAVLDKLKDDLARKSVRINDRVGDSASSSGQAFRNPKELALARKVRIMKLRGTSRGPPNIPDQDKLYFEAKFCHEPRSKLSQESKNGCSVTFFATSKLAIGRMVDWSAVELDLVNKNQTVGCDQLIFIVSGTNCELGNQENFRKYLDSGQLSSGDLLLLTYKCD